MKVARFDLDTDLIRDSGEICAGMEGERFRRFIGMGGGLDVFVIGRKR